MSDSLRRVRSYVIRTTRMSEAQKRSYRELSEKWVLPYDRTIDWESEFPECRRRIVEIGFGMGDATWRIARDHSDWALVGVEVHRPGVGKLLWWLEQEELTNVRIIEHDAVEVLAVTLRSESLDGIHIWFPDPWPKKRHHKRRLIQPDFIQSAKEVLKPGGYIHIATDWEPYAEHILQLLSDTPG
ncbi:MAG: tRNA (guanosine(46)-N7)-methyltransferase TrmB, partial [Spirochaetaceae bacterium]|nr:tRNA (guanosine(46)-N7)-methyltransferase TrmB [Spirochaetaceae bacterium]